MIVATYILAISFILVNSILLVLDIRAKRRRLDDVDGDIVDLQARYTVRDLEIDELKARIKKISDVLVVDKDLEEMADLVVREEELEEDQTEPTNKATSNI